MVIYLDEYPLDDPPAYAKSHHQPDDDADDVFPPVVLRLDGTFVVALFAESYPMYALSRNPCHPDLPGNKLPVTFERLNQVVRNDAYGEPRVTPRNRHIYDLTRPSPVFSPFSHCLDAVSRKAVGNMALKTVRLPRPGFKIVRTVPRKEHAVELPKGYRARKSSVDEGERLFLAVKRKDGYHWSGPDGKLLAVQEGDGETGHRLRITASVSRPLLDALVAGWCLKLWADTNKVVSKRRKWGLHNSALARGVRIRDSWLWMTGCQVRTTVEPGRQILPRYW